MQASNGEVSKFKNTCVTLTMPWYFLGYFEANFYGQMPLLAPTSKCRSLVFVHRDSSSLGVFTILPKWEGASLLCTPSDASTSVHVPIQPAV